MNVSSSIRPSVTPLAQRNATPPKQESQSAETITKRIVDGTVDATLAGTNRVSSTFAGLGTASAAYLSKLPRVASDTVKSGVNLFQAETIGPNIKVLAGLATPLFAALGVAGAGLGLVISAGSGAIQGWTSHDSEKPREFTIGKAVDKAWTSTRQSMDEAGTSMVEGTQEVKDKKLAPGEDPWDIPLPPFGRTAKTMAATVAGIMIGGVGGLVTALATTAQGAWSGVKQAFTKFGPAESLASVGTVVGSPVTGVLHGVSKIFTTPVKAAEVAWKEKSLGGALKAAVKEGFDLKAGSFSTAAGATVGGAVVAVPSALSTVVSTTAVELGRGLKSAATDKELNLAARGLATLGSVVSAPVAGVAHGLMTGVSTPFRAAASSWKQGSLVDGMTQGVKDSYKSPKLAANTLGALVGGVAVGGVSAVAVTATGAVREIGGGLLDAAGSKELNVRGKLLDGIGGIPGDAVTAVGQGLGTLFAVPIASAREASLEGSNKDGIKSAAQYGVKAVSAAANPKAMVEQVAVG